MLKRTLVMGSLAALVAFAVITLSSSDSAVEATHLTGADYIGIDANPTGNTATSLGTRDDCIEVTSGGSVDIDITISNIPSIQRMIGFAYKLYFDPDNVFPSASDSASYLIGSAPGSAGGQVTNDATPGLLNVSGYDTGPVPGSSEVGSGVLTRITFDAIGGPGAFPLHLVEPAHIATDGDGRPAKAQFSAQIAIDTPCAGLPAVEPPPARNGDVDCSGGVNAIDALKVLRFNAGLSVAQTQPCNLIGYLAPHVGDVDCSGAVNAIDALKILRHNAGLSVAQTEPCDDINT
jgi:hypothetical protein